MNKCNLNKVHIVLGALTLQLFRAMPDNNCPPFVPIRHAEFHGFMQHSKSFLQSFLRVLVLVPLVTLGYA